DEIRLWLEEKRDSLWNIVTSYMNDKTLINKNVINLSQQLTNLNFGGSINTLSKDKLVNTVAVQVNFQSNCKALLDTGATVNAIYSSVIKRYKIPVLPCTQDINIVTNK